MDTIRVSILSIYEESGKCSVEILCLIVPWKIRSRQMDHYSDVINGMRLINIHSGMETSCLPSSRKALQLEISLPRLEKLSPRLGK